MPAFEFYDAAGNKHPFETLDEARAFAESCGYRFVTSRSVMEGDAARIYYYVAAKDVPEGVSDPKELFPILLSSYREWEEPRIMPVIDAGTLL